MTVRHVSCLTFVPDVTEAQLAAIRSGLAALPERIPQIRAYAFGDDLGVGEGTADLAVVADFDDADGYRAYATHPAHLAVLSERIRPVLAARAIVQFRVDG